MFRKLVTTLGLAVAMALGTLSVAPSPAEAAVPQSWKVREMVSIAYAQRHDQYGYGSAGPSRFDCSGLVYYSIKRVTGRTGLPRTSRDQARATARITASQLRRGDLIFFHSYGRVYHVSIYWGRGYMLSASNPRTDISIERIWSKPRFYGRIR